MERSTELKTFSITIQAPFLAEFPFTGANSCLEMYNLFVYEPLNNLHLGVSKLLKTVASELLSSKELFTTAFKNASGQPRTFFSF